MSEIQYTLGHQALYDLLFIPAPMQTALKKKKRTFFFVFVFNGIVVSKDQPHSKRNFSVVVSIMASPPIPRRRSAAFVSLLDLESFVMIKH